MAGLFDFDFPQGGLLAFTEKKRRVFISYHHGGDRAYYDEFSERFCAQYELFHDNSPEREIDSDNADYTRWRLSEKHIHNTSSTIVLIGQNTWGRRFVDWEIDITLEKRHGLLGILLPRRLGLLGWPTVPPPRFEDNLVSSYASLYSWNDIIANPFALKRAVDLAISRSARLINNERKRRYVSASLWDVPPPSRFRR
jgi:MTH538 TIR-like domain (DUF1863)